MIIERCDSRSNPERVVRLWNMVNRLGSPCWFNKNVWAIDGKAYIFHIRFENTSIHMVDYHLLCSYIRRQGMMSKYAGIA